MVVAGCCGFGSPVHRQVVVGQSQQALCVRVRLVYPHMYDSSVCPQRAGGERSQQRGNVCSVARAPSAHHQSSKGEQGEKLPEETGSPSFRALFPFRAAHSAPRTYSPARAPALKSIPPGNHTNTHLAHASYWPAAERKEYSCVTTTRGDTTCTNL